MIEQKIEQVPWTTQQTFNGVFFTLVPWITFTVALSFFNTHTTTSSKLSPQLDVINAIITFLFSTVVEGAFLIAPYLYARRTTHADLPPRRSIGQTLGFRGFNIWQVIPLLIALMLVIIAVNGAYQYVITTLHLHIQTNDQVLLSEGKAAPISTYATLLAAVIVAPICEEIFFRSFVFMGLLRSMPLGVSVILSALIFAVAHGDPGSFAVLFIIGLALAFLRWRTQSIWPGIMLHMLNNGISALLIVITLIH